MKKILIAVLVIVVIAVAGLAAFVATFDLDRYNKPLAAQISSAVGNPVEIGRLKLAWKGAFLLEVEKFRILAAEGGALSPALSFDRADLAVDPVALLHKELKVSSLTIVAPRAHIVRAKDGTVTVRGYNPKAAPAVSAPAKAAAAPVAFNFKISSISVRDGAVRFEDRMGQAPSDIAINRIDAAVTNVSLTTPVDFSVKAALLGPAQNAEVSGTAGGFVAGPLYIKDLDASLDLGAIDHAALARALPAVDGMGLRPGLKGLLKARVEDVRIVDGKIGKAAASLELTGGVVPLASLKAPIEGVRLAASLNDDRLLVTSFSARLANATLTSSADIQSLYAAPRTALRLEAAIPGVKDFLAAVAGGRQYLDGKIALAFDGTMTGSSWDEISRTLSGTGTLSLDSGVLLETNLVRQSLSAIALFPGLLDSVAAYLPAEAAKALTSQYTLLRPIEQTVTVSNGVIDIPNLRLGTDYAVVTGAASLTLAGDLAGTGMITFSPELSAAMIKGVPEMKYLADRTGLVGFPVVFKASGAGTSVVPDVQYIATRAVAQKGQELMSDLLKKATAPKDAAAAQPASAAAGAKPTEQKTADKVAGILQAIQAMSEEQGKKQ